MDGAEEPEDPVQAQVIGNSRHIGAIMCYLYIAQYLHTKGRRLCSSRITSGHVLLSKHFRSSVGGVVASTRTLQLRHVSSLPVHLRALAVKAT